MEQLGATWSKKWFLCIEMTMIGLLINLFFDLVRSGDMVYGNCADVIDVL